MATMMTIDIEGEAYIYYVDLIILDKNDEILNNDEEYSLKYRRIGNVL